MAAPPPAVAFPLRLAFVSLLAVLGLFPPETRGEGLAGASALVAIAALLRWPALRERGEALAAIVIGVALAGASARAGLAPAAAVEPVALVVLAAAVGLVAARVGADRSFAAACVRVAAAVGSLAAAHGLYQKLWGLKRLASLVATDPGLADRAAVLRKLEAGRAFAGFATPAALGAFLALTLPLTIAVAVEARSGRRAAWVAAALLQVGALAATASATAVAALAGAILLAILLWTRARATLLAGLAGLLVVLAAVAVQRGALLDPGDPGGPWQQRVANWRSAWEVSRDHPWLGVGPGAFAEATAARRRPGENEARHAHNLPLEFAAELGWPGAVLAGGALFALLLGPLWRERDHGGEPWRRGAAIGLASFALHNLADFTFAMPSLLWTAAMLRGLLARSRAPDAEAAPAPAWLSATALVAVVLAAVAAMLSGVARESRLAARAAAQADEGALALALATRAVRLAPWDIDAALTLAGAASGPGASSGSSPELQAMALERAERAVLLAPTRAAARDLRARARLGAGDRAGALADWEQAVRLDPGRSGFVRARDQLRRALAAEGR